MSAHSAISNVHPQIGHEDLMSEAAPWEGRKQDLTENNTKIYAHPFKDFDPDNTQKSTHNRRVEMEELKEQELIKKERKFQSFYEKWKNQVRETANLIPKKLEH